MISQFSIVALVHFLAVASPGPDFILVSRQAFLYGRNSAIYTTLGISCGIFVHVLYCIFGLGYILNEFQDLIFYLKLSCSIYLAYLGIVSIFIYSKSQFLNQEKKSLKQIENAIHTNLLYFMWLLWQDFITQEYKEKQYHQFVYILSFYQLF